jgi:hypothetical protein
VSGHPSEGGGDDPTDGRGDPWWSSDRPGDAGSAGGQASSAGHGPDLDPRLQAGLDHLQRAAREVIAASRALLDVAEELVDDPKAAAGVVDLLGSLGAVAARRARSGMGQGAGAAGAGADPDDGDDEPPVQRIPVS